MPNNSIRDNLSKEDIIAEIRLTLGADIAHKRCIVVVEGQDDILFFRGKLNKDVIIEESYSGKLGVLDIVSFFFDDRVIGVCDIDYDGHILPLSRIFTYDYCCLEMMIISCEKAFSSFCNVYYSGCLSCNELRYKALEDLLRLSLYRKKNEELSWGLNFKGLSFPKYYNKVTENIDYSILDGDIQRINPEVAPSILRAYLNSVDEDNHEGYPVDELLSITQGHDFINYFKTMILQNEIGKHEPSRHELIHSIICSYHYENFTESALYRKLKLYQEERKLTVVIS